MVATVAAFDDLHIMLIKKVIPERIILLLNQTIVSLKLQYF